MGSRDLEAEAQSPAQDPSISERERLRGQVKLAQSPLLRGVLLVVGTLSLILGLLGIPLPVLPTTPFLLLSAACYARASERFYLMLLTNRWFGRYILDWREGRGVPKKVKVSAVTFLWIMLASSTYFTHHMVWPPFLFVVIGAGVTVHILKLPSLKT